MSVLREDGASQAAANRRDVLVGAAAAVGASMAASACATAARASEGGLIDSEGLPSTIEIDHVSIGSANLYSGSERLFEATGLGSYEGGWFPPTGIANRIVPLGGDHYIEVESCIDAHAQDRGSRWFRELTANGDCFIGWCLRVTTREELERIARRLGVAVAEGTLRKHPDGTMPVAVRAPESGSAWIRGLPSFFFIPDFAVHPARGTPVTIGSRQGGGIAWMELGGTKAQMQEWLGVDPDQLALRFNGGSHGLYAMGIRVGDQILEVRHPPIPAQP